MKKILITGGSGLLGLNWAEYLKDKADVTLVIHRNRIDNVDAKVISLDLLDVNNLQASLSCFDQYDLIIHCAALTDIELCEREPDLARNINSIMSENIAKVSSILNIPIIYISTDQVFDGLRQMETEESMPNPLNVYARTKLEGERRVLLANTNSLIIRTNFFGWGLGAKKSFSDYVIYSILKKEQIYLFEDYYHTPILMQRLFDSVNKLILKKSKGVFHIVGSRRISKLDFGYKIAEAFGLDSKMIRHEKLSNRTELTKRPFDISLSNAKYINEVGDVHVSVEQDLNYLCMSKPRTSLLDN